MSLGPTSTSLLKHAQEPLASLKLLSGSLSKPVNRANLSGKAITYSLAASHKRDGAVHTSCMLIINYMWARTVM